MSMLFENRITDEAMQAIQDLTAYVADELQQMIDAYGEESPEAAECFLVLIAIEQIIAPNEEAHARIDRYLTVAEQIYGLDSIEVANGFLLLGWSQAGLGREEEAGLAIKRSSSLPDGKREWPPVDPMLEAMCKFLGRLQSNPDAQSVQHAFVLALHTLSWLVTMCPMNAPAFSECMDRIRPVFESWGFRGDLWEWLMRRCCRAENHFVGLLSVLMEEGMFPPKESSADGSPKREPGNLIIKGYEIVGMTREHWQSPEGFSGHFPAIAAEGDLSLRVERLLAEGCRCLRSTGELETVFLIFSDHLLGRRITAFGTQTWSDEEKAVCENKVRDTIAEYGADSAMMLTWVDLPRQETPKSDNEATEAVMVVARDEKSYLVGLQPAMKVDGKYVFDQPIVRVAKDNWFSEFTFPVPRESKIRARTGASRKP